MLKSKITELKRDSYWVDEYLKIRSYDRTGQRLNLFLNDGRKSSEYEWDVKDNKWSVSRLVGRTLRCDVAIQKINAPGATN